MQNTTTAYGQQQMLHQQRSALSSQATDRGLERGSRQMGNVLGWFSIGLGLAELLAPRTVARATGVDGHTAILRALGARELASGIGILSQRRQAPWLWSRVAGDAMDLALLAMAARSPAAQRQRLGVAAAAVAGIALADTLAGMRQSRGQAGQATDMLHFTKSIAVNRTTDECYRFWRNFESFPRFMAHLELVQQLDDRRSHWKARAPGGTAVEWDAEITEDIPGQLLAWRSLEGADVENSGTVRFERAPGGRGTVIRVEMQYRPPAGRAGAIIAKLFGEEPKVQVDGDLRRFKQLIETGEIATTVGQPSGRRSVIGRMLRKGEPG